MASLTALPFPDEIKHHHRVGEQRHHRREDAERDVPRDVGPLETEHRRGDQADETDADRREKRLSQGDKIIVDPPSAFVAAWLPRIVAETTTRARALDLAMGRGRHALALARAGFRTFGVDAKLDAVREVVREATARQLVVRAWCADLTNYPLPREAFDLVVVTRYLQRDLFGSIGDAVAPGGFLVYETFTVQQRALGTGPRSADHLLELGELRGSFDGFDVRFYEETSEPEAVARLVARKRIAHPSTGLRDGASLGLLSPLKGDCDVRSS